MTYLRTFAYWFSLLIGTTAAVIGLMFGLVWIGYVYGDLAGWLAVLVVSAALLASGIAAVTGTRREQEN